MKNGNENRNAVHCTGCSPGYLEAAEQVEAEADKMARFLTSAVEADSCSCFAIDEGLGAHLNI
jgi:hypothetical protein